jgi:shikimate dehydrogenase
MGRYGLIGRSLEHSFSKTFFEAYFHENKINASFELIELAEPDQIPSLLEQKIDGLCVTIPFKEQVIPFLDELSDEARLIGAVNVLKPCNGKWIGHNSDAYGFHQSIKPFLTSAHEHALILGTGGASKAVQYVLKNLGITCFFLSRFPKGERQFSYDACNQHMISACKLIVNCTPIGTFPNVNETPEIPFQFLTDQHLVIDLIYNPPKSLFLKNASMQGATTLNGASMLSHQALKAWEIWNA